MSRYGSRSLYNRYGGFGEYESKAQKLAKAKRQVAALRSENPDLAPIHIEGRLLARTWWGKAWNANLERYSDLNNRLERGRAYVRNGSILDLQINVGRVTAQIMGSGSSIYQCTIKIDKLSPQKWQAIKDKAAGSIPSIAELLAGKLPEEMLKLFTSKKEGLFPASSEIKKSCNCPDYASLCKHLAATLYGIGARFDHKPELIFTLRGLDPAKLVSSVIKSHKDDLINRALRADQKRQLKLKDNELAALFEIDFAGLVTNDYGMEKKHLPDIGAKKKVSSTKDKNDSWRSMIKSDLNKPIPATELIRLLSLSPMNSQTLRRLLIPVTELSLQQLLEMIVIKDKGRFRPGMSRLLAVKSVGKVKCRKFINELLQADLGSDFLNELKNRKKVLFKWLGIKG